MTHCGGLTHLSMPCRSTAGCELDEVLVDFCKRGRDGQREAMLAIRATHPQISSTTIWARIVYLGLSTSKRPPYCRHEWSAEDLELLRSGYSDGRNGASRTIDVLLERHPDWSRSVIRGKPNRWASLVSGRADVNTGVKRRIGG